MGLSPRTPQYTAGTIAIAALSGGVFAVTGVGTNWVSPDGNPNWPIFPGDRLVCGNSEGLVGAVVDSTHLSLQTWSGGVVAVGSFYAIYRSCGMPNSAVAGLVQQLSQLYTSSAAALAAFQQNFFGAFASDSTANSFASANQITLANGQIYFNTTEGKLRTYSGSAWADYDASAQAAATAAENAAAAVAADTANVVAAQAVFFAAFLGAFASDSAANSFAVANAITLASQIYFNTTEGKLRTYSSSAWADYDASAQAAATAAENAAAAVAADTATVVAAQASVLATSATVAGLAAATAASALADAQARVLVGAAMTTANNLANVVTTATFIIPNIPWSTYYGNASGSPGAKTINLGSFTTTTFVDEQVPVNRMALSQGSSSINLGGVPT